MSLTRIMQAGVISIVLAAPLALGGAALADTPPVYVGGAITSQPSDPTYSGGAVTSPAHVAASLHWHHEVYENRLACGIDRA